MRKQSDIPFGAEIVTPDLAKYWLANSPGNRQRRSRAVSQYTKEMNEGRWNPNVPPGILINTAGQLINGHHTCEAIIAHGKPIATQVRRNVPDSVVPLLDAVRPRTVADNLRMMYGVTREKRLASSCRIIERLNRRTLHTTIFSTPDCQLVFDEYKDDLRRAIDLLEPGRRHGTTTGAMVGAVAFAIHQRPDIFPSVQSVCDHQKPSVAWLRLLDLVATKRGHCSDQDQTALSLKVLYLIRRVNQCLPFRILYADFSIVDWYVSSKEKGTPSNV